MPLLLASQLGDRSCRSKTCKRSSNPRWGEALSINSKSISETLIIKVFNQTFNGSSFLGQAVVALSSLAEDGTPSAVQLALQTSSGRRESVFSRAALQKSPTISLELTYNALNR